MTHHLTLLEAFISHQKYAATKEEKAESFVDAAYWQGVQRGMMDARTITQQVNTEGKEI